jgi:nitrogen fixation/metabolism regulation signal transduction histidine kinase
VKGFRRRRRRFIDADFQSRLIIRFVGVIVLSTLLFSIGFLAFYWVSFIAGDNLFKEFLVVYKQIEAVDDVEINGRTIQQRSYTVEAQPETSRWRLILPPLVFNNLLIAVVLSVFAIWYSHRIAGPVYRITADVRSAVLGRRGVRIHLRRRDELRDLAAHINRLLEELDAAEGEDEWADGKPTDESGANPDLDPG